MAYHKAPFLGHYSLFFWSMISIYQWNRVKYKILLMTPIASVLISYWKHHNLVHITGWLRANKVSLNVDKTEIMILRSKQRVIKRHLDFGISGQKINVSTTARFLGALLNQHLDWSNQLAHTVAIFNRCIGLLSKIRHYVSSIQIGGIETFLPPGSIGTFLFPVHILCY